MKRLKAMVAVALLAVSAACASAAGGGTGGAGGRGIILLDEITASGAADAYTLVQSARPQWLRVRGDMGRGENTVSMGMDDPRTGERTTAEGSAARSPSVYLNNARMGTAETLRQIPLTGVRYVRWFTPAEANLRWGTGNTYGAIQVSTEALPGN
jgi:hypothetical protein